MSQLPERYRAFADDQPAIFAAYEQLGATAAEAGPLDQKSRELIKLGMAAALRAESAVHSHVHRALAAGASRAEIEHAVLIGITTLGFPTMMTALSWVRAAFAHAE
ncbi:MAG: carboxymuconolactone decarboxylase family protein [Oscillochloridaceae bacterium umkhey_bin13]